MTDAPRTPTPIDEIAEAWVDTLAELAPTLGTYIGRIEDNDRFGDFSPAGHEALADEPARRSTALDAARARRRRSTRSRRPTCRASSAGPRAPRGAVAPARPQRDRFARAGHSRGLRSHADRHRGRLGVIATRLGAVPGASTATSRRCARASREGVVPARRQVVEVADADRPLHGGQRLLRRVRRAKPPRTRDSSRHRSPATRRQLRMRRASPTTSCVASSRAELAPAASEKDAVGRELYALHSRRFLGATIDLDETYEWGHRRARPHGRRADRDRATRSCPAHRSKKPSPILEKPTRRASSHGTDALQRWMQETSDRAVAELGATHFDIPEPIRTPRVHDRADAGGRHLLHRPHRRLLAPRPHVVVGARGRHRVRHLARTHDRLPRGRSGSSPADRAGRIQPRAS